MRAGFKMEGWKEMDRALGQLPKATARNTIKRGLKKAAVPVEEAMENTAPRLTGWTGKSIQTSFQLNPANKRDQKREGKAFAEIYIGTSRGSAAHLLEYGTFKMPANPWMRRSWEATKEEALVIFSVELKNEIEKSVARYARKLARAGG